MPSARSRGGQPGNTNALKHGFYSDRFSPIELNDLDIALEDGLSGEISALRVLIRRFYSQLENSEDLKLSDAALHLQSVGAAMTRLASLLRTDRILNGSDESAVMGAIHQALTEFTEDLK